jgi:hypothetical protein
MYKNFKNYIWGAMGFSGTLEKYVLDMTKKMIDFKNHPSDNLSEFMKISPDKLVPGRFYLIKYDFNGNPLWCPILALDYKVHKNNHILYAVNLEYLPPRYKILMFYEIFKQVYTQLEIISQKLLVKDEAPLNFFTFEFIYKFLQKNGKMNWAITAYTIKNFEGIIKIKEAYLCSIKIAPEIIFSDFKRYNSGNMKELQKRLMGEEEIKLGQIIEQYDKIIEGYQADSIEYHKKVALFREKLKLFNE